VGSFAAPAIVAAMNAGAQGGKLAGIVGKAVELSGRGDLRFTAEQPTGVKGWNDQPPEAGGWKLYDPHTRPPRRSL